MIAVASLGLAVERVRTEFLNTHGSLANGVHYRIGRRSKGSGTED